LKFSSNFKFVLIVENIRQLLLQLSLKYVCSYVVTFHKGR